MMHTAYIGIGSNRGDRLGNCLGALRMLSEHESIDVVRTSRWYESEAWGKDGPADQPPYLNAAAELATSLAAADLLAALQEVEHHLGRPRVRPKGEPRTIDLDLLFYDRIALGLPGLTLPHPELSKRLFVLLPLCDIAPGLIHPILGQPLCELAADSRATSPTGWIREWNSTEESA